MRILLPPSETKCDGGDGPPLDLDALGFPELTATRRRVATALVALVKSRPAARRALGLTERQDEEIARNRALLRSPTRPAVERYAGVLFDALEVATLTPAARRRLDDCVVITSALFGAVRAGDPIPAYRLSAGSRLPGLPGLPTLWKPAFVQAFSDEVITLDLRSGAYAAFGTVRGAVTVQVIGADGRTVSHHNKAIKGRLTRALVGSRRTARTVDDLVAIAGGAGIALRRAGERRLLLVADA